MKIDSDKIKNNISEKLELITYDEIDSTNDVCKKLGNLENLNKLVVSDYQTSGKGRLGRTFISKKGKGIYMSLLVKPNISLSDISKITCVVATSISRVLEKEININIDIKWVNDLYLNNKKICGILTESSIMNNELKYIVIGIGINLYKQTFPKDIIASSIEDETGIALDRELLISNITNQILEDIKNINDLSFVEYFRKRLYMKNKLVELNIRNDSSEGIILDISDNFELVLDINGNKKLVNSGEIIKVKEKKI